MTEKQIAEMPIDEVVARLSWKFAKSMPKIPHWYTVRQRENPEMNALYARLYYHIAQNFYILKFYSKEYKYCNIGKHKYWIMADDLADSTIINRTPLDEDTLRSELRGIGL